MIETGPDTAPDNLWLVIADTIASLSVPRDPDGLLPRALVYGDTRGVLLWRVEDRLELLVTADPTTTSRVTSDVVRTAARATEQLAAPTVELRLDHLWRNPETTGLLGAVIALTAKAVVVNDYALDLRSEWGFAQWARFRSIMRMSHWELPHWHPRFDEVSRGAMPSQLPPRRPRTLR